MTPRTQSRISTEWVSNHCNVLCHVQSIPNRGWKYSIGFLSSITGSSRSCWILHNHRWKRTEKACVSILLWHRFIDRSRSPSSSNWMTNSDCLSVLLDTRKYADDGSDDVTTFTAVFRIYRSNLFYYLYILMCTSHLAHACFLASLAQHINKRPWFASDLMSSFKESIDMLSMPSNHSSNRLHIVRNLGY